MKLKVFPVLLPYIFPSLQSFRILNVFGRFEDLFEIISQLCHALSFAKASLKIVQIALDNLN